MKNDSEPQKHGRETSKMIILGESLIKFSGKACTRKGYNAHCYSGIRFRSAATSRGGDLLENKMSRCICETCRYQHARHGISTTEIMRDTMDPVECIRKQVPKTKIIISRVPYWHNKS
jgi:hypothetical protein